MSLSPTASHGGRIRVIVADDHHIVRRGLVSLLATIEQIDVVGEAADGRDAVDLAERLRPDIVLMDISMPGLNGLEATRMIRSRCPEVKVLILSAYDHEAYVLQSIRSGANGYLLKHTSAEDLQAALLALRSGEAFFSPAVSRILAQDYRKQVQGTSAAPEELAPAPRLTPREREILQLIAEGKIHQQIADLLHISPRTVDTHRNNIMQKLDIHDTAGLVTYAIKNGIVILPDR